MNHAAVGDSVAAAGVNVDGRFAVHEDLDVEAVIIIAVIHPEGYTSPVGLGILYLLVEYRTREIHRLITAGAIAHILPGTGIRQITSYHTVTQNHLMTLTDWCRRGSQRTH